MTEPPVKTFAVTIFDLFHTQEFIMNFVLVNVQTLWIKNEIHLLFTRKYSNSKLRMKNVDDHYGNKYTKFHCDSLVNISFNTWDNKIFLFMVITSTLVNKNLSIKILVTGKECN